MLSKASQQEQNDPKKKKQAEKSEISPQHCYKSHKNTKLHNNIINAEGLGQTKTGFLVVASVSVRRLHEPLVNSLGHFLVVSLILGPYNTSSPSSTGLPQLLLMFQCVSAAATINY